jgi:two-component system response regulator FixJ
MSHQRTVYVIDHDLDVRRSLTGHVAAMGAEAWPFHSGVEFLEIVDHLMPACILLDMDMPGPSGIEVLRSLALRQTGWPVIAMSEQADVPLAVQAMKLGALDFLLRPPDGAALAAALVPAFAALEKSLEATESRRAAQDRVSRLTPREVDIALALLAGRPNKAVAHEFGISVRTVEMHRAHIMAKLGVKSLAEAAVLATQAGLLLGGGSRPQRRHEPALLKPALRTAPAPAHTPFLARSQPVRSAV